MENLLLARFPAGAWEALRPHAKTVALEHGARINHPDEPVRAAVFPLTCLLSLVTTMEDGSAVESGCIGREGFFGIPAVLDAGQTPMETIAQVAGEAIKLPASVLKEAYDANRELRSILNRYIHVVTVNGSQSAACNAVHQIRARLCRWILASSDGVGSSLVRITHEYLAVMLGVRRPGVTVALGQLEDEGLVRNPRGAVEIVDRERLEACACECYRRTKDEYERLFGA